MLSIYALANSFLKHSFKEDIPITYKKLRYLLALSQVVFYNKTGSKLFVDDIVYNGHSCNIIISSIDYKLKCYKSSPVDVFIRDAKGKVSIIKEDTSVDNLIFDIWNKYKNESSKIIYKDCCSLSNFRELCSKQ